VAEHPQGTGPSPFHFSDKPTIRPSDLG